MIIFQAQMAYFRHLVFLTIPGELALVFESKIEIKLVFHKS